MKDIIAQNKSTNQRFEFGPVLGRGGMATVYSAYDTVAEQTVAIKVLYDHFREHPFVSERFRHEVTISQSLEHPNIVKVHSLLDTPEQLGMVMELHGTGDLKNYLMRNGPMPWKKVVAIGSQILQALELAHQAGVVHQDIKPHNILLDDDGLAKLIDFGAAHIDEAIALARPESAMATVEYSAPEQFDDLAIDARADLYSLGITLFEMLSNSLPYRSETAAGVIQMHREAPVADIRVFVRNIPEHVAETLLRAMAKEPEDRFESATEMRRALENQATENLANSPLARSNAWEYLKAQTDGDAAQANWNLFLPPLDFIDYLRLNATQRTNQISALLNIFNEHSSHYQGSCAHKTPGELATTDDSENSGYHKVLAKNRAYPMYDVPTKRWHAVPLACGLTFSQAAKIRHQLGSAGLEVTSFQFELSSDTTLKDIKQRLPDSSGALAGMIRTVVLFALPMLFVFGLTLLLNVITGMGTSSESLLFTAKAFGYIALPFATVTAFYGYAAYRPGNSKSRTALLRPQDYILQFNAPPPLTTQREQKLLQNIHGITYNSLQSKRLRATYERIVLQLLQHATPENLTHTDHLLAEATILAEEIAATEQHLIGQNQASLFDQLARIDAQLSCINDTDLAAEFIEQKLALTQQLRELDDNRQKLTTLGNQLLALQKR